MCIFTYIRVFMFHTEEGGKRGEAGIWYPPSVLVSLPTVFQLYGFC